MGKSWKCGVCQNTPNKPNMSFLGGVQQGSTCPFFRVFLWVCVVCLFGWWCVSCFCFFSIFVVLVRGFVFVGFCCLSVLFFRFSSFSVSVRLVLSVCLVLSSPGFYHLKVRSCGTSLNNSANRDLWLSTEKEP